MNTFHLKKWITSSDIDDGWVISAHQICEITDIGDIKILRYGDDSYLEHVFRASKSVWNPVPTSMSAVCSHYNHKLDFRLQFLERLIADNLFVSIHILIIFWYLLASRCNPSKYCVIKLQRIPCNSLHSWQSITHSRNYIIVTYRLRNCNSWEFRRI